MRKLKTKTETLQLIIDSLEGNEVTALCNMLKKSAATTRVEIAANPTQFTTPLVHTMCYLRVIEKIEKYLGKS